MAHVKFTRHLKRFFPTLTDNVTIEGETIASIVANLDVAFPGLAAYIIDERGTLRKHVNIFIGQEMIHDREKLQDSVQPNDQIFIFQALSGG